jgi:hypothetical protein
MSKITMEVAFERFKTWYSSLSIKWKEKILKYCYENRPRKNVRLSELFGFENTGKAFDLDLAQGQISEQRLKDILSAKMEVKTDSMVGRTGNVAIEYFCRGQPSGIATTEADWWAIVFGGEYEKNVIVIIARKRLLSLVGNCKSVNGGDNNVAKMYLLPKERLLE